MADLGTELTIDTVDDGLSLRGEVDAHTAPRLEAALAADGPSTAGPLRIHMSELRFMDSSGLRVIIAATESARADGRDVVLVDPTQAVRRLLDVSGLSGHLTVEPADPDA